MIGEHPPATTNGDDGQGAKGPSNSYQHAVAAALVQLGETRTAGEFAAPDHPISVGEQYGQHSPLLRTLMREGVGITTRNRSRAGHVHEPTRARFRNCSLRVNGA